MKFSDTRKTGTYPRFLSVHKNDSIIVVRKNQMVKPMSDRIHLSRRPFLQGVGSIISLGGSEKISIRRMGVSDSASMSNDWRNVGRSVRLSMGKIDK